MLFAELSDMHQHAVAVNLWAATGTRLSHSKHDGAFIMPWKARQKMYGTAENFSMINNQLDLFECVAGARPAESIAKAWTLTATSSQLLDKYFDLAHVERSKFGAGLIDTRTSKAYRMQADAIRSVTSTGGKSTHPRHAMLPTVEVDGNSLHEFHNVGEAWLTRRTCPPGYEWAFSIWDQIRDRRGPNGGAEKAKRRVNDALAQASAMLHIAKSSSIPGYVIPTTYMEYPSGRLFAEGALTLQTCQREVRRAALRGKYDVDISNCHWSLISQMARRIGLEPKLTDYYLNNKRQVRKQVALAAGISEADAKEVLIGLIYGMNLFAHEGHKSKAIVDLVGAPAAALLRSHPLLVALHAELKKLGAAIIQAYEQRPGKKGFLINDAGKAIANSARASQKLAHILQGAEAAILKEVVREHGPMLSLLAHDGWVMAVEPDLKAIERLIHERTGFFVHLECAQL